MPPRAAPRVLYSRRRIARRVRELGAAIDRRYRGRPLTLCGVLTGGVIFAADLARALSSERVEIDFVRASSYGTGTVSRGRVDLQVLDRGGIAGRDVVVVEDILETGRTLDAVVRGLRLCGARSVRTVVLLEKPGRPAPAITPDWIGFRMKEDVFVAGYGLDSGKKWRNLPDIVVPPGNDSGRRGTAKPAQRGTAR